MKTTMLAAGVLFVAAVFAPLRAQGPGAAAPPAGVLKVVGVSVFAADPQEPFRSFLPGEPPGIALVFAYSETGRAVLGLAEDSLRVKSFTDGKGTDLAADGTARLGPWPQVGDEKDRVSFSVISERTPVAGAREIRLEAVVKVLAGADLKTATQEGVALANGTVVTAGALRATVEEVSDDGSGDSASRSVTFTSETGFAALKSVEFLDEAGTPIEASEYGSSTSNDGEKTVYGKTWNLPGKPVKVSLRVTYWEKVEAVEVPIDVAVGVGL